VNQQKGSLLSSWHALLGEELKQPYMQELRNKLLTAKREGKVICPPSGLIFNAFNSTQPQDIRVVILGQDPYHNPGQAHGLSFSVEYGMPAPPSLINIYKELERDLGIPSARHGNLEHWAKQGVLLLNCVLTVEQHKPASHKDWGWERFTDRVIEVINDLPISLVFLLWGSYAQNKVAKVDSSRHLVLRSPHPSPLSAYRGFFGNGHFSRANDWLINQGREPIDWQLPD
jgi:uracil-DNA glycosylase